LPSSRSKSINKASNDSEDNLPQCLWDRRRQSDGHGLA
jgi:hypothetical protein